MSVAARQLAVIMRAGVRDAVRRRLFLVILVLSIAFLALYSIGLSIVWHQISANGGFAPTKRGQADERTVVASTFTGLSLFAVHFLGAVTATFLVLGAVRGDAESGVLQPVLVRPLARGTYLLGRFAAGALVTGSYVTLMSGACMVASGLITGWWADEPVLAALRMAGGSVAVVALALAGSVVLGAAANGVATFMVFGLALLGGLLDQLGEGIGSQATRDVGIWMMRFLPFEAMYQWSLAALTADTHGIAQVIITLGPFGGARDHSGWLLANVAAFCAVLLVAAGARLRRLDL